MKKKSYSYIFLLLPFMFIACLILAAVITVILQSLGYVPALGLETLTFSYYFSALTDPGFLTSLAVSLKTALFSSVSASAAGTLLCAAMVSRKQNKTLNNSQNAPLSIIRIPILVPHAIVAIFMINIFSQTGILARISYALGSIDDHTEFGQILFTESYIGVILAYLWKEIPFVAYFVFDGGNKRFFRSSRSESRRFAFKKLLSDHSAAKSSVCA